MRVLFHLLDAGTGGGQLVARRVAERLAEDGADVAVVVPAPGPATEAFEALGAVTHVLDARTLRRPAPVRALARLLKDHDVLYSHTEIPGVILGAAAATAAGRAHVVHQHNAPYFSPVRPVRLLQQALFRTVPRRARFIAVAEHVGAGLEECGIPRSRIEVIPNGVPLLDAADRPPTDAVVVGMLARLDPRKNIHVFLDAAAAASPSTAVRFVVGAVPGPFVEYERAVRAQAEQAGIEIAHTERGEEFLRTLDVVVVPSSYEGSPLVLYEAMAAARAVVASDIPGIHEALAPEDAGVLVPPLDTAALTAAIEMLVDDPDRRAGLGRRARQVTAARYDVAIAVDRAVAVLAAAVS